MKRSNLNFLTLLFCSLFVLACTEKVSDDVEQTGLTEVERQRQQFNNKSIRLVDKNDKDLSFFLHKAGSLSAPCEIPAPVNGFSAETYDKANRNYAADCILDVEELDLWFHGAKIIAIFEPLTKSDLFPKNV